jgi:hypothetical protein
MFDSVKGFSNRTNQADGRLEVGQRQDHRRHASSWGVGLNTRPVLQSDAEPRPGKNGLEVTISTRSW